MVVVTTPVYIYNLLDILLRFLRLLLHIFLVLSSLFHEELGYVLEVQNSDLTKVENVLNNMDVKFLHLGVSTKYPVR